ncbi:MAG: NAD(P)/FAD-dependent oxidoreductase [Planctomycetota bacterium]|nr:NAD(P)/FAD-dependent oxidoreductase [Planctomycetota bacterium]
MQHSTKTQVVVIGGGFAGMSCVRALRRADVEVKLIDRRNFHLFQPLLYQVASGGLSPANIAAPLRSIFRKQKNAQVLLGAVADFDMTTRNIILEDQSTIPFDYLVVATGSTHHYFGKDAEWEPLAPGLKTIEDATEIRRRVLSAFEEAERTDDLEKRSSLLTFVVVGGGPTGVEMAGAICELAHQSMKKDFRTIDPCKARVVLVENSKLILDRYHATLSAAAARDLTNLGAEIWNETRLMEIKPDHVMVSHAGESKRLDTHTVIWAAGVKASMLGKKLTEAMHSPDQVDRSGRVAVDSQCSVVGHPNIFVTGDLAAFSVSDGKTLPGVAPVAVQQGHFVGNLIAKTVRGSRPTKPFEYWDKGNMATIGRSHAILEAGKIRMTGRLAWFAWLFIHIMYLARFENRMLVLFQWFWNYSTRNRTARLITGARNEIANPNENVTSPR